MVEHLHRVSFSAERTPRTEMLAGKGPHLQAQAVVNFTIRMMWLNFYKNELSTFDVTTLMRLKLFQCFASYSPIVSMCIILLYMDHLQSPTTCPCPLSLIHDSLLQTFALLWRPTSTTNCLAITWEAQEIPTSQGRCCPNLHVLSSSPRKLVVWTEWILTWHSTGQ